MSPLYEDEERALERRVAEAFRKADEAFDEFRAVFDDLRKTRRAVQAATKQKEPPE